MSQELERRCRSPRVESLVLEKCQERTAGERFDSPRLENLHSCPQCPAETVLGQEFAGQRVKETCAAGILRTVCFLAISRQSLIDYAHFRSLF